MRKLVVCNLMSLDGYYEAPDKNVMPLFEYRRESYPADESFDAYNVERLRAADTLLLGRVSYEGFKGYWPPVAADPNATPITREISQLNNAIHKVVVSDSLTPDRTGPWQNTTRIIRRADAHRQIAELKQQTGKDILMFGSRTLWNDLLLHDLVDEIHIMISPVVLSSGTPLFEGKPPVSPRLIDTHTWDGSGIALVRYDVRRSI
jgi:dihydrofolate reductase